MKKDIALALSLATVGMLCASSCSGLSSEAKEIVGTYYNTELSQTEPVMVLNDDAKCVITAIKPGVLTYSVEGTWNVKNDSLIVELNPESITYEGDSTLIGSIPLRVAQKLISHNEFSLQLENGGVSYLYQRRNE